MNTPVNFGTALRKFLLIGFVFVRITIPLESITIYKRKRERVRGSHSVLLDFVQHGPVADLEHTGCCLSVPAGSFQCGGNGITFGLRLHIANQRLERSEEHTSE